LVADADFAHSLACKRIASSVFRSKAISSSAWTHLKVRTLQLSVWRNAGALTDAVSLEGGIAMADTQSDGAFEISRDRLGELLNEDLAREYQAIISYVVYSQVLSGAQYTDIAAQLEIHARQELDHALIISRQIDYLGKMPAVTPKPVRTSKDAVEMLRFDLENENETVRNYRDRVRQCEALGEYAMAEQIRQILMQEQDHQIDLATALGEEVPDLSLGPKKPASSKHR